MQSLLARQYNVADLQDCSPLQVIAHDLLSAHLKVELRHAVFPEHPKVQLPFVRQLNWVEGHEDNPEHVKSHTSWSEHI